jgi:hypothetical protein
MAEPTALRGLDISNSSQQVVLLLKVSGFDEKSPDWVIKKRRCGFCRGRAHIEQQGPTTTFLTCSRSRAARGEVSARHLRLHGWRATVSLPIAGTSGRAGHVLTSDPSGGDTSAIATRRPGAEPTGAVALRIVAASD